MKRFAWTGLSVMFVQGIVACGSTSGQGAACDALAACCASLSGGEADTCEAALSSPGVSQATCTSALQPLVSSGICAAAAGSDGGGGGGGGDGGSGCVALAACCPQLPVNADPTECMAVAMGGTSEACTESLSYYGRSGYCVLAEVKGSGSMPIQPTTTCPTAGQLVVSVTGEGHPVCNATVTASQGVGTWDLNPSFVGGACSYVGNSGESGVEIRIAVQAPGYAPGSSTVTGGECDGVLIVLDPAP
jgi:hypothetical protein